jgi:hypothetical protein
MALFIKEMKPTPGMKILDLGGYPGIWDFVETPLNITCLNLPGNAPVNYPTHHQITYVAGDACDMPYFQPGDFDLIFSNSVIEHVGDRDRRRQFAREVQRLSDVYWIQTPSKFFPIEAHCGMPFWWFYPESLRSYFIEKWRDKLPEWTEMVEATDVVTTNELKALLPGGTVKQEWFFFPKSLVVYQTGEKSTQRKHEATSVPQLQNQA